MSAVNFHDYRGDPMKLSSQHRLQTLIILKLSKHRFLPEVTFLVCLMHHVDEGFIFRSKYTYEAKSAPYEMATMMSDPSNTATWQKAKLQGNNDTLILPVNSLQEQTLQLR
ncbi:hypothetical protein CAPTEDRAFT_220903 [Capitella teleta]|uniref:Uncharacterized protein n=1 Tax=Capitella teleta TaxID=283909 RepID=R7USB3_CAPTE|nr:hypothetical protein CAPTEDRAFT_220903 [Capitella teleta]|eukprot:ELU09028.1 hypothetical protein CAPTEDRAFT_220903 [Capitella teleta]